MTEAEIAELRATWESHAAAARQARIAVSEAEDNWRDAYFKAQRAYEALKAAEQAAAGSDEPPTWPGIGHYQVAVTRGAHIKGPGNCARNMRCSMYVPEETGDTT